MGESNVGEKIFVTQASSVDSSVEVEAAGEAIRFKNLRGGADAKITFELPEDNYALGVAVYEDRTSQTVRLSRAC